MNYIKMHDDDDIDTTIIKYNFIGITERYNESLILLKHELGLEWEDLLYVSKKVKFYSFFLKCSNPQMKITKN